MTEDCKRLWNCDARRAPILSFHWCVTFSLVVLFSSVASVVSDFATPWTVQHARPVDAKLDNQLFGDLEPIPVTSDFLAKSFCEQTWITEDNVTVYWVILISKKKGRRGYKKASLENHWLKAPGSKLGSLWPRHWAVADRRKALTLR